MDEKKRELNSEEIKNRRIVLIFIVIALVLSGYRLYKYYERYTGLWSADYEKETVETSEGDDLAWQMFNNGAEEKVLDLSATFEKGGKCTVKFDRVNVKGTWKHSFDRIYVKYTEKATGFPSEFKYDRGKLKCTMDDDAFFKWQGKTYLEDHGFSKKEYKKLMNDGYVDYYSDGEKIVYTLEKAGN